MSPPSVDSGGAHEAKENKQPRKKRTRTGNPLDVKERNKLSAAKYRKKRKLYVENLECKVAALERQVAEQTRDLEKLRADIQASSRLVFGFLRPMLESHTHTHTHETTRSAFGAPNEAASRVKNGSAQLDRCEPLFEE